MRKTKKVNKNQRRGIIIFKFPYWKNKIVVFGEFVMIDPNFLKEAGVSEDDFCEIMNFTKIKSIWVRKKT